MGFLTGKTAIITGAGRAVLKDGSCGSIGYGIATAYAKEGANLVITGRNVKKLEAAKQELENLYGIKVLPVQADVCAGGDNEATVANVVKQAVDTFGGIQVYVPQDMDYGGSHLSQGYQTMDGAAAEFFLRTRHIYADSDLGRLRMQRYFYAALFARIAKGELISREASAEMLAILRQQHYNTMLTHDFPQFYLDCEETGEPELIWVASKSGSMNACRNDGGIVHTPYGEYVIVLMNKDFHDIIEYNDHPSMVYGARVSRMILDQILACEGELYK